MKSPALKFAGILLLGLFAFYGLNAQSTNPVTESVLKTAKSQISNFTRDLPESDLASYGFNNRTEFEKIGFGDPIPVYTLKDSVVVFTSTWRVPLVIEGEYRSLLTVIEADGQYKAVDFGASELARAYAAGKTPETSGMLRVYELHKDYFIQGREKSNQTFIPIEFKK